MLGMFFWWHTNSSFGIIQQGTIYKWVTNLPFNTLLLGIFIILVSKEQDNASALQSNIAE